MRLSLVVFFCLLVAVVHSATTRRVATTAGRAATKAPIKQSAYTYLRSIRGNRTCTTGTCPFWERHGRSFAALRCYSQEYQDCACLHRMCFSSCFFTREVCNQEMVGCLRQICPRCMPASASAMCSVYDSMAERVAEALSVFACYPCCPSMMANQPGGSNSSMMTTTPTIAPPTTTTALATETIPIAPVTAGVGLEGELPPSAANGGNLSPGEMVPSRNQRVQATVRTTKRVVTTPRTSATTRRLATSTAGGLNNNNKVKTVAPTTTKSATTKKVQATTRPKS